MFCSGKIFLGKVNFSWGLIFHRGMSEIACLGVVRHIATYTNSHSGLCVVGMIWATETETEEYRQTDIFFMCYNSNFSQLS